MHQRLWYNLTQENWGAKDSALAALRVNSLAGTYKCTKLKRVANCMSILIFCCKVDSHRGVAQRLSTRAQAEPKVNKLNKESLASQCQRKKGDFGKKFRR